MSEVKAGMAFHCHHEVLYEFVYDFDERVKYIKANKPPDEQKLRLKLFQLIPDDLLPGKDSPEWVAYKKEWVTYEKAWAAFNKALVACDKALVAYDKAKVAFNKAWGACNKAWAAYDKAYGKDIEELHKKLCLDCPWDGKTIFTKEV